MTALFVVFSGLFGAAGVAGAAVAAYGSDTRLVAIAAAIALVHAPALIGLVALRPMTPYPATVAGVLMVVGTLLFSGDLAARAGWEDRLFVNAAPLGGMLLIAGWLAVALSGVSLVRRARRSAPMEP